MPPPSLAPTKRPREESDTSTSYSSRRGVVGSSSSSQQQPLKNLPTNRRLEGFSQQCGGGGGGVVVASGRRPHTTTTPPLSSGKPTSVYGGGTVLAQKQAAARAVLKQQLEVNEKLLSELKQQRQTLQTQVEEMVTLVSCVEPDAIEEAVDRHHSERQAISDAPDELRTSEVLHDLDQHCNAIAASILKCQEDRVLHLEEVEQIRERLVSLSEETVLRQDALDGLLPSLQEAETEYSRWREELEVVKFQLVQEQDATFGLSGDAASLIREAERLDQSKLRIEQESIATEIERRRVFALHEELKGAIRVYCRVKGNTTKTDSNYQEFPSSTLSSQPTNPSDLAFPMPLPRGSSLCSSERRSSSFGSCVSMGGGSSTGGAGASCGTGGGAKFTFDDAGESDRKIGVVYARDNATSTGKRESLLPFEYDRVFRPSATQKAIYEEVGPLVDCAVDGYRVCILAYGQTGSGKTYTMEGPRKNAAEEGIIPRAIRTVFERKEALAKDGWKLRLTCFMVEIYNDAIRDLLEPSEQYHKAFFLGSSDGNNRSHEIIHRGRVDTTISGVREIVVHSLTEVEKLLDTASNNRSVAKTSMNDRSSRSHSIFTMRIEATHEGLKQKSLGNLCLVDLAGSERVHESGVQGAQLKEAVNINKSLSFLGDCIAALTSSNKSVPPWRNCKLTWLLQNYLSGEGAKVLMVVNVSDKEQHTPETINSLRFAAKVGQTFLAPAKRRVVDM